MMSLDAPVASAPIQLTPQSAKAAAQSAPIDSATIYDNCNKDGVTPQADYVGNVAAVREKLQRWMSAISGNLATASKEFADSGIGRVLAFSRILVLNASSMEEMATGIQALQGQDAEGGNAEQQAAFRQGLHYALGLVSRPAPREAVRERPKDLNGLMRMVTVSTAFAERNPESPARAATLAVYKKMGSWFMTVPDETAAAFQSIRSRLQQLPVPAGAGAEGHQAAVTKVLEYIGAAVEVAESKTNN
jgi:hypothetical protein